MTKYKLGCIKSPKDIRDYRIAKLKNVTVPDTFELPVLTVLDQGNVGSCVPHSMAAILEHIFGKLFATAYLYGIRYNYTGEGMTTHDVLKTAQNNGCPLKEDFDVSMEVPDIIDLVAEKRPILDQLAKEYKIGAYASLNGERDMKTAIMRGLPIIFSIDVHEDNLSMSKDYIINMSDSRVIGGHAMIIYGWNEKGWLIQNSWGKEWGKNGTAILPYDYKIWEAFAVSPKDIKDKDSDIKKPNFYFVRELLNFLIKLFGKIIERK